MKATFLNILLLVSAPLFFTSCEDKETDFAEIVDTDNESDDEDEEVLPETIEIKEVDGYPRLFFTVDELPNIIDRTKVTGWYADLYKSMKKDAELYATDDDYNMVPFLITDQGKYSTLTCGRELGTCLMDLAFCGYVEGNAKYIRKAVDVLMASSDAMLGDCYNKETGADIDQAEEDNKIGIPVKWASHLQAGDGAYAWALGYDLLYPFMTDEQREQVKQDLLDLADWLYTSGSYSSKDYKTCACNHTSVHYGPLGLIALLFPEATDADIWLEKAKERVSAFVACSADLDGYILEGHTYQGYGLHGAYPFIHALKKNKNIDLAETMYPGLSITGENQTGTYFDQDRKDAYGTMFDNHGWHTLWKLLPNGHMLSMNDSRDQWPGDAALFGALLSNNGVQLQAWLQSIGYKNGVIPSSGRGGVGNRFLMFTLGDEPVEPVEITAENAGLYKKFEGGRVFARSGWGDTGDALMSFTSGYDGHQAHNHYDENNVTFCANGVEFLYDAPYEANLTQHHSLVQVTDASGNEIVIDDNKKEGKIENAADDGDVVTATGDATYAYNNKLNEAKRNIAFVRESPCGPYLFFRDDISLPSSDKGSFRPQFITHPDNTIRQKDNGVIITGKNFGKALILTYRGAGQIKLVEHQFGDDEEYTRPNKSPFRILDYYRMIEAQNPIEDTNSCIFTTLVIPFISETLIPEISVSKSNDEVVWTLKFADDTVHKLTATATGITKQ